MIKVIKLNDNDKNYMFDPKTNKVIEKYAPNSRFILKVQLDDGSELEVDSEQVHQNCGGQIYFIYADDKYIVDDGYRNTLIRCGYIIADNYDKLYIHDRDIGLSVRSKLLEDINLAVLDIDFITKYKPIIKVNINRVIVKFTKSGYNFTVIFDTVNGLVSKNLHRKGSGRPFYPFRRDVDKYGSLYMSIFCEKKHKFANKDKEFIIAEDFISYFISIINRIGRFMYHYGPVYIHRRVIYVDGL